MSVIFARNVFVAAGDGELASSFTVATSGDGIAFSASPRIASPLSAFSVAYNNRAGVFGLAGTIDGRLAIATTLSVWTPVADPFPINPGALVCAARSATVTVASSGVQNLPVSAAFFVVPPSATPQFSVFLNVSELSNGGSLTLLAGAIANASSLVSVAGSELVFHSGSQLTVSGLVQAAGSVRVVLRSAPLAPVSVLVMNFESLSGSFAQVLSHVESTNEPLCAVQVQGATSLSLSISTCSSSLSLTTIITIVVIAVFVGAALAIGIVVVSKLLIAHRGRKMNEEIRRGLIHDLKSPYQAL